jgi:hypothetical protein
MGDQKLLTVDVLRQFGFVEDPKVQFSDLAPGHSFDFGNFELTAAFHLNLQFARVASFGGLIVGVNSLSQIDFEVPFLVESVEQCAAWIAWHLDGQGAASASRDRDGRSSFKRTGGKSGDAGKL